MPNKDDEKTTSPQPLKKADPTTILVDNHALRTLSPKPGLFRYIGQLWKMKHFISMHAQTKANSKGRDRYLGSLWIILDPIFQVTIYAIIFGLILKVDRGMDNFLGFLIIGVIFFGFFSTGINGGAGLIQSSRALISSFKFPRATVVISTVLKQLIDNIFPAVLAVVGALAFQLDKPISWTLILVIPLFLLAYIFILGMMFIAARITAFVPDFKSIIAIITRGLFFISGVFFDISRFDTNPFLQGIVEANPIYQFLMAVRGAVMDATPPDLSTWLYLSSWTFATFFIGFYFFYQAETRYSVVK